MSRALLLQAQLDNDWQFSCNSHTICDDELKPIGAGLYPLAAVINHSCQPNCVITFQGNTAFVRTITDVEAGSELNLSYIEIAESTEKRRRELRENYHFDCDCVRCSGGVVNESELSGFKCESCAGCVVVEGQARCERCGKERDAGELLQVDGQIQRLLVEGKAEGSIAQLKRAWALAERHLHPHNIALLHVLNAVSKLSIDTGQWQGARQFAHKQLAFYQFIYPINHPLLGLQHFTVGKLENLLEQPATALKHLQQAVSILSITHSTESHLLRELSGMVRDVELECREKSLQARSAGV